MDIITNLVLSEFKQYQANNLKNLITLLNDGNTIPFIARYRKEMTGSLDEVEIKMIHDRYHYLASLEKRKEEVLRLIEEQDKLTPDLKAAILQQTKLQGIEDLYRPFKQKRRTKATIAKEKGLEPLANFLLSLPKTGDLKAEARKYISEAHEVIDSESALLGAIEILAEYFADDPAYRSYIRDYTRAHGVIESKLRKNKEDEKGTFEMYYDYQEPIKIAASHRVLALNRGEKEDILKVSLTIAEQDIFNYLNRQIIRNHQAAISTDYVIKAYEEAYKRFIQPAIERELRGELTEKAQIQAIHIFGENLRNLLLQAPLKEKTVMGFDPAYRTGCKLAIVDKTGKVLAIDVIYPIAGFSKDKPETVKKDFIALLEKYQVDTVAIGNGTASRESELFVATAIKSMARKVYYVIVNEAGASVYSASEIARKEFPDLPVEKRSAVSIARRIQDPLAELVKIDPKSVGVGQYQHDVSEKLLNDRLAFVVETAVNQVGVNVNSASPQLLEHIAGLTKTTAQNIVSFRDEYGLFTTRATLAKIPRLGPKAFEQAVGFLRIPSSNNVFDNTSIHPESYPVAEQLLKQLQIDPSTLGQPEITKKLQADSVLNQYSSYNVGKETFKDIINALISPGRDFREEMHAPLLREDVLSMADLKPGMELQGTVRNVVDFGAFVDIGVKQDGLVHISKLSNQFVKHPTDVVAVGDIVKVWVDEVDLKKNRIQLAMIQKKK